MRWCCLMMATTTAAKHFNVVFAPGGVIAISRWLSEATPPVYINESRLILNGSHLDRCQSLNGRWLAYSGAPGHPFLNPQFPWAIGVIPPECEEVSGLLPVASLTLNHRQITVVPSGRGPFVATQRFSNPKNRCMGSRTDGGCRGTIEGFRENVFVPEGLQRLAGG